MAELEKKDKAQKHSQIISSDRSIAKSGKVKSSKSGKDVYLQFLDMNEEDISENQSTKAIVGSRFESKNVSENNEGEFEQRSLDRRKFKANKFEDFMNNNKGNAGNYNKMVKLVQIIV